MFDAGNRPAMIWSMNCVKNNKPFAWLDLYIHLITGQYIYDAQM